MSKLKSIFYLLKETFDEWNKDHAPRLAAALSYYTIFSIAPFLIVVIAIVGFAFGQEAVQGTLDEQIQGLIGREGADMIQELILNSRKPSENIIASVVGVVTLLLGAGGVFGQLKDALNTVWNVAPKPGNGLIGTIRDRFLSFTMVLGVGFLLAVSLLLNAFLSLIQNYFVGLLPGTEFLLQTANFVISFGIITILFAMIYKVLPDAEVKWRDVWVGAAVTSLLFTIGKTLLGIYLGNSGVASSYGAAGSIVLILLWIFYSSQILLFGAEFTQVYARKYGSKILPDGDAVALNLDHKQQSETNVKPIPATATLAIDDSLPMLPADQIEQPVEGRKSWIYTPLAMGATIVGFLAGLFLGVHADEAQENSK